MSDKRDEHPLRNPDQVQGWRPSQDETANGPAPFMPGDEEGVRSVLDDSNPPTAGDAGGGPGATIHYLTPQRGRTRWGHVPDHQSTTGADRALKHTPVEKPEEDEFLAHLSEKCRAIADARIRVGPLAQFIAECTIPTANRRGGTTFARLFSAYSVWARQRRIKQLSLKGFLERMEDLGVPHAKGRLDILGVKLRRGALQSFYSSAPYAAPRPRCRGVHRGR